MPEHFSHSNNIYEPSSNEFHRLPSITSMTIHQTNTTTPTLTNDELDVSFEDDDDDHSTTVDSQYQPQSNGEQVTKAYALYDFNGKRSISTFVKFQEARFDSLKSS
jgi:hypothetical protein